MPAYNAEQVAWVHHTLPWRGRFFRRVGWPEGDLSVWRRRDRSPESTHPNSFRERSVLAHRAFSCPWAAGWRCRRAALPIHDNARFRVGARRGARGRDGGRSRRSGLSPSHEHEYQRRSRWRGCGCCGDRRRPAGTRTASPPGEAHQPADDWPPQGRRYGRIPSRIRRRRPLRRTVRTVLSCFGARCVLALCSPPLPLVAFLVAGIAPARELAATGAA